MGTIGGNSKDSPIVECAFAPTPFATFLSLSRCYEDVVKPYCKDTTSITDVGSQKCKDQTNHVGGKAGCIAPNEVCCAKGKESQKTCDPAFVVPDTIP